MANGERPLRLEPSSEARLMVNAAGKETLRNQHWRHSLKTAKICGIPFGLKTMTQTEQVELWNHIWTESAQLAKTSDDLEIIAQIWRDAATRLEMEGAPLRVIDRARRLAALHA